MKKNNHSGRSMIEMLGVIAIIAVLSVGSVYAIKQGMVKQQANAIIADVNLAYTSVHTSPLCESEKKLVTFQTKSGKAIQTSCQDKNVYFVYVPNIPEAVCYKIAEFTNTENFAIYNQSDMLPLSACLVNNHLAFSFDEKKFCAGTECGSNCCLDGQICKDGSCLTCPTKVPDGVCKIEAEGCSTIKKLAGDSCGDGVCSSSLECITCPAGTSSNGAGGQAGYGNSGYVGCFCNNAGEAWDGSTETCLGCPQNSSGKGTGQLTSTAGCYCNEELPYWSEADGGCVACPSGMKYVGRECIFTNDNCNGVKCGAGQYCSVSPNGWCQGGGYYKMNTTASCVDLPSYKTYVSPKFGAFAMGNTNLTYWNSNNVCEALGGRMFTESDSGCSGASSAETGVSRSCSNTGWTSGTPATGAVDSNGVVQGCTYSEILCELYHLGGFNKNPWIGNAWREGSGCNATRLALPGGFSTYRSRNQASYVPLCVLK